MPACKWPFACCARPSRVPISGPGCRRPRSASPMSRSTGVAVLDGATVALVAAQRRDHRISSAASEAGAGDAGAAVPAGGGPRRSPSSAFARSAARLVASMAARAWAGRLPRQLIPDPSPASDPAFVRDFRVAGATPRRHARRRARRRRPRDPGRRSTIVDVTLPPPAAARVGLLRSARARVGRSSAPARIAAPSEHRGARVHRDVPRLRRPALARSAARRVARAQGSARRLPVRPGRAADRSGRGGRRACAPGSPRRRAPASSRSRSRSTSRARPRRAPRSARSPTAVRAAGGGPTTFLVRGHRRSRTRLRRPRSISTSRSRPSATTRTRAGPTTARRRTRARSCSTPLTPGTRTWGWIAHRWHIPVWYVWDALYWHDRHNRKGAPLPGRALDPTRRSRSASTTARTTATSTACSRCPATATPCQPTLRLAAIRRGLQDRALLELAASCDPDGDGEARRRARAVRSAT